MAVTQYIGARYVPKFYENSDGTEEWRSGVEYEPLTIVTYNANSYTSKKPVPSNIGNPSDNTEYWVATGLYNAQVELLRQQVLEMGNDLDSAEDTITALENANRKNQALIGIKNNKIAVFIGDSYAAGTALADGQTAFPDLIGIKLGLIIKNYAIGGSGFFAGEGASNDFLTQANTAASDSSFDHQDCSFVIITGGRNDSAQYQKTKTEDQIMARVQQVVSVCGKAFPNAKIIVIPMLFDANIIPEYEYYWYWAIIRAGMQGLFDCTFVKNGYTWLTGRFGYINADNIHPNNIGHRVIASCIIDVIRGGDGFLNYNAAPLPNIGGAAITSANVGLTNDKDLVYLSGDVVLASQISRASGIAGLSYSTYTNIPVFFGNQKIPCMMIRYDNNNEGAYPVMLEYVASTKTIILRALADIPLGSYKINMCFPFGRYNNAVTG